LKAKNAAILGVSFDTVQENKQFAEKFKFPYPLLSDTTRAMGVQYGRRTPRRAATRNGSHTSSARTAK